MCRCIKGFFKLKKIKKSEKNSKVGGWVGSSPYSDFFFLGNVFFLCFFVLFFVVVHVSKKVLKMDRRVGVIWPIRVFLGFVDFFNLTRPPKTD